MRVQVANLQFSYGTKKVLSISNAEFEQGKIYAIVGRNGVGKTTFFKALTNIITNYSGQVLINGENVKQNPRVLSRVGIVLDDMELYKNRTGLFNLRYFGGLRGGFDEARALKMAHELGISNDLNQKVSKYSLGMNKKLILLISLMSDAQILIFDEPFRGLDRRSVEWFRNYLLYLKNNNRMILISSHVQEDIEALSDNVLVLLNGDFVSEFDLRNQAQVFIYQLEVNDKGKFAILLWENRIGFSDQGKFIEVHLQEEKYKEIFRLAVSQGIEFYQIKKESQFVRFVK